MDRFLLKRKRADAFEEIKDNEEGEASNSAKHVETPKKKRRIDDTLSGSEFEPESDEESDEESDDESDYDPDQENKNTSNKNKKTKTTKKSSNSNNKKNELSADPKDAEIRRLRIALREMTGKYNKMKLENDKLKKQIKSTPAKSSNNNKKLDLTKIKKKYLKKWATRLPKVAGMKKTKFVGMEKEIIIEEMGFDREEFDAIFGDKGYLVQPRPDNKPKSTVIIKQFSEWENISELFGEFGLTEVVTVSIWRSRNFSKSYYCGDGTAKITELNACYNKSRKVLQLKFQCERECGFFW